jgi:SAM-dependent methyltransferase
MSNCGCAHEPDERQQGCGVTSVYGPVGGALKYSVIDGCRSCGDAALEQVLDLGAIPLTGAFMEPGSNRSLEPRYPLTVVRCLSCSLLQLRETVDPTDLYQQNYPYYSSFSESVLANAHESVDQIMSRKSLDTSSLVVELASNDGYLLQWFAKEGVPVLGIDPAWGPAAAALASGIPTLTDFFDKQLAERLVSCGIRADVIIGNNVLAHVPDQDSFVASIATLLAPDGLAVMEVPYLVDLIDQCEFDTIYHEHHCYFTVGTIRSLFARHGFGLVNVQHLQIHGGSLRVSFERDGRPDDSVSAFISAESERGVGERAYYIDLADRVGSIKEDLVALLWELKSDGARIAAYGAAAKGVVLLNYCGLDEKLIDYVVDLNPHKHGLEMPGVRLPVHPVEHLRLDPPDYLVVLAWNFKDEIMQQQAWYSAQGGRFIIPIPSPAIV